LSAAISLFLIAEIDSHRGGVVQGGLAEFEPAGGVIERPLSSAGNPLFRAALGGFRSFPLEHGNGSVAPMAVI